MPLEPEKPGDPTAVRIVGKRLGACASDYKFHTMLRLPLKRGEKYRLSVQVRTHGLGNDMQALGLQAGGRSRQPTLGI